MMRRRQIVKPPKWIMDQMKSKKVETLIAALLKDGWKDEHRQGAVRCFHKDVLGFGSPGPGHTPLYMTGVKQRRRVTIHYHNNKAMGTKELLGFIDQTGWKEPDMRRLKLIK